MSPPPAIPRPLRRALRWAADSVRATSGRRTRVLLVTDGVATAGETGRPTACGVRRRISLPAAS